LNTILQDIRFASRGFLKRPLFTAIAVMTLIVGIGVNTAVFGLVNRVLLEPLSYPHADRLIRISGMGGRTGRTANLSRPDFRDFERGSRSFESLSAFDAGIGAVTVTGLGEAERVRAVSVCGSFFSTLEVAPEIGRLFDPGEEDRDPNVTVLSYAYWQRRFGGNPAVIGRSYYIGTQRFTIVGVLRADFHYPQPELLGDPDMYGPMPFSGAYFVRSSRNIRAIGRLRPGASVQQAQADLSAIAADLERRFPSENYRVGITVRSLAETIVGDSKPVLWLSLAATLCVLLIGCANLINLLLARGTARRKEMAIRGALGAGRGRLVRQLMTESLLLSAAGGLCAVVFGNWVIKGLVVVGRSSLPRVNEITLDTRAFAFSMFLAILVGIIVGVVPAVRISKTSLEGSLRQGGRTGTTSLTRHLGSSLIGAEVALSVMLLVTACLLVRSFWRLSHIDPGFNAQEILTAQLSVPLNRYPAERNVRFYDELYERLERLPGVQGVAATNILPLSGNHSCDLIRVDSHPNPQGQNPCAETRSVSDSYFRVMSVPIVRGRSFDRRDDAQSGKVVVINRALAEWLWPGEDPLGQTLTLVSLGAAETPRKIIGICGNTIHMSLSEPAVPQYFLPQHQQPLYPAMSLVLRAGGDDPGTLIPLVRAQLSEMDPNVPLYGTRSFAELMDNSIARPRFQTVLFGAFALLALVLALGGVYGVLTYTIGQRSHELGIRRCLGARTSDIVSLLALQSLVPVAVGAGIGLVGATALARWVGALLYGVHPLDPGTFALVPMIILATSLVATFGPIHRATAIDPAVALRVD
jgi:putative ABC transport system permease protein